MELFTNQDAKSVRASLLMLLIFDLVCSQLIVMIKVNNMVGKNLQKKRSVKFARFECAN